jgi:3-phenylpropionate/trans-cinnamate dioxygenase ferredoxin subunit
MNVNYKLLDSGDLDFVIVAPTEEIGNGERMFVEIGDHNIVVFNIAGKYFAIADLCSHDDGPLGDGDLHEHEVFCPRHGARFDVRDGKALSFPAVVNIPAYPIRVKDGNLELGLPKE